MKSLLIIALESMRTNEINVFNDNYVLTVRIKYNGKYRKVEGFQMDQNMTLEKRIAAELYSYQGRMSVFVDDLRGSTVEIGADDVLVPIMYEEGFFRATGSLPTVKYSLNAGLAVGNEACQTIGRLRPWTGCREYIPPPACPRDTGPRRNTQSCARTAGCASC